MKKILLSIYQISPFLVAISVAVIVRILSSKLFQILQYAWSTLKSIRNFVLEVHDYAISEKEEIPTIIIIAVFMGLVSYFVTNCIKKGIDKKVVRYKVRHHFAHSYGLVKDDMIPRMNKMVNNNTPADNEEMDRYIQSPIEYATETVKGNRVPEFYPDDSYQDILFNPEIKYIVAITAENPNLWMDPTLCFYMANCYAVSLMRHANKKTGTGKKNIVVKNFEKLKSDYLKDRSTVLKKLSRQQGLDEFQFVRFFLYDKEQRDSCISSVFPSLKASQDLFRTLSFFILKESIQKNKDWDEFKDIVASIWDLFPGEKVIDIRKEKTIPEFLVLYFQDNHVEIHSYFGGKHKYIDNKAGSENYVGDDKLNDFDKIMRLIAIMAIHVSEKGDDLRDLDEKKKNHLNTFIDWE